MMVWVAGKPLIVKTSEGRYEDRRIGDPVPEAPSWPVRQFESHKNLGWIVQVEAAKPVKRRRKKVKDVTQKG